MERIKYWHAGEFSLTLWDTGRRDHRGQSRLKYRLRDGGRIIFEGEDFAGSPMHADDSMSTVRAILAFLSLRLGDTDKEYFDKHTPEQLEWRDSGRAEELAMYTMEPRGRRKKA